MRHPCCRHCPFECVGAAAGHDKPCRRPGCGPYAEALIVHEMKCGHCGFRITSFRQPCPICPSMLCRSCASNAWHPVMDGSDVPALVWEMP